MRGVANSVSVVTTRSENTIHGATVSAFCSVSADPPTVLVCLKSDSRIAREVLENRNFCVNVVPDSAGTIADRFAGHHDSTVSDRFEGIGYLDDHRLPPVIDDSCAFSCELDSSHTAASHTILVGRVTSVCHGMQKPLLWLDGEYCVPVPNNRS